MDGTPGRAGAAAWTCPTCPPGHRYSSCCPDRRGAGKDAVRDLLRTWQLPAHFAVTATTRPRRPEEVDGVDYRFISEDEFTRLEREGGLLEHAVVYGQRKGVPRTAVAEPLAAGQDVIVRVDVQGAATLKRLFPAALLIFIAPPPATAERRLSERGTESAADLRLRIGDGGGRDGGGAPLRLRRRERDGTAGGDGAGGRRDYRGGEAAARGATQRLKAISISRSVRRSVVSAGFLATGSPSRRTSTSSAPAGRLSRRESGVAAVPASFCR